MAAWVKNKLSVIGAVAIVAIGFIIWHVSTTGETRASILQSFGYLEMAPPSNFHGPGTLNTIEVISNKKIQLHPTCEIDEQSLSNLTKTSNTADHALVQKLNKSFNIIAKVKKIISSEIVDNQAKDIFISFKNVKILSMSDEALVRVQKQLIKEGCQEVIELNLKNGGTVCQTRAVLEADVVYKIAYKEDISVSEQRKLTANVASKFKIETEQIKVDEIIGKRLFYGVQLAPFGILLNTPDAKPENCRENS